MRDFRIKRKVYNEIVSFNNLKLDISFLPEKLNLVIYILQVCKDYIGSLTSEANI